MTGATRTMALKCAILFKGPLMKLLSKSVLALSLGFAPTISLADFSGAYAGAGIGTLSGKLTSTLFDSFLEADNSLGLNDSAGFTGFAGYQIQNGAFVYGGEIAINAAPDAEIEGADGSGQDGVATDVKARLGYVFDTNSMAFATVGYTAVSVDDGFDEQGDLEGFLLGAGIDHLLSENVVVGAEFTMRDTEGATQNADVTMNTNSFALRVAYKF
ncbi:porin family protein [Yoonia sp. BS5-3]|uniref:Outer membrane protein n=1 Tax=Yoonia phaeophyticola TaxID=3137369 RepID=A0ABZ2VA54_9RHOB